jgi:hypothetical protein
MSKQFWSCDLNQACLLPPSLRDWCRNATWLGSWRRWVSEIVAAGSARVRGKMEDDLRRTQSVKALLVRIEFTKRISKPAQPTKLSSRTALPESKAPNPTLRERGMARKQTSESLSPTELLVATNSTVADSRRTEG